MTLFSLRTEKAIRVAIQAHAGQVRKGRERTPYVSHPVHVALMLALQHASEEAVQAGLLHDVVEDCEEWTVERVAAEFGQPVADIVAQLTEDKRRTWEERKQYAVEHVPELRDEAVLVKACDKLHNLRALVEELRGASDPDAVWKQFRGGRERTLSLSRAMVEALARRAPEPLAEELRGVLADLEALAG